MPVASGGVRELIRARDVESGKSFTWKRPGATTTVHEHRNVACSRVFAAFEALPTEGGNLLKKLRSRGSQVGFLRYPSTR